MVLTLNLQKYKKRYGELYYYITKGNSQQVT